MAVGIVKFFKAEKGWGQSRRMSFPCDTVPVDEAVSSRVVESVSIDVRCGDNGRLLLHRPRAAGGPYPFEFHAISHR